MAAGRTGSARAWAALALLVLLPALAATAPLSSIVEEVDVTGLALSTATITYAFGPDGPLPAQDVLERRCSTLPSALSCSVAVDDERRLAVFTVVERRSLSVEGLALSQAEVSVSLALEHRPLQFLLSPGASAPRRELVVRHPTHETVVEGPRDEAVRSSFELRPRRIPLDVRLPSGPFAAGGAVPLPPASGALCVGALLDGDSPVALAASPDCRPSFLALPASIRPARYRLALVALEGGEAGAAESVVSVSAADVRFNVTLDAPRVRLGEPVAADVSSELELVGCTASLSSPGQGEVARAELEDCSRIVIGTSTAWGAGRYLLQVAARTSAATATSSLEVVLAGPAPEPVGIALAQEEYQAGDTLELAIEGAAGSCESVLLDGELREVARDEGCGERLIELDPSLEPGAYVVQTRVYDHGRLAGMASRAVEVRAWSAAEGSPMASLCPGGSFGVEGEPVPCIGEGEECEPSSDALPVCLCFDGRGEPSDACQPTDLCASGSCAARPRRSPYVIVRSAGSCTARRGAESFRCVGAGEVCDGFCVCLGEGGPVSSCEPGQTCTAQGCSEGALEFEPQDLSPPSLDPPSLEEGATLVWTGVLRGRGSPLGPERAREASAHGRLGPLEGNASVGAVGSSWRVSVPLEGRLSPGAHEAMVEVMLGGERAAARRPFEVLYPPSERELAVKVVRSSPGRIDAAGLRRGASVRLELEVLNAAGGAVGDLRSGDFALSLGGLRPDSSSATLEPATGAWTAVATFSSTDLPRADHVEVAVSSLGRRGSALAPIELVEEAPAAVRIVRASPGTADRPLFDLLLSVGFSMDIYLDVRSSAPVVRSDISVSLGGVDVSRSLSHIVATDEGVKLHLAGARLPEGPSAPRRELELEVTMMGPEGPVTDRSSVVVEGNPGGWSGGGGAA